jgi:hypothetical protein
MMALRKWKCLFIAFLGAITVPAAAQEVIAPYPHDELAIRAAVRVLTFASPLGGLRYVTLAKPGRSIEQKNFKIKDPERATQESVLPEIDFIDFVKSSIGECAYDRRDFVPVTADGRHFALKEHLPIDHYVIWHTRLDFHRLSDEARRVGYFSLRLFGNSALCKYETRAMTKNLDEAIEMTSRGQPPSETVFRCYDTITGPSSAELETEVLRAIAYMHTNICAPLQMPF